jgi:hypothetical protein
MEVYLSALVSFYLKPNRRIWTAGQRESTIKIIAPKKVEKSRTRDISEEEASHRLSFLATIVDSEGYAIRGDSAMKDEYAAEADTVEDVLEADNPIIDRIIEQEQNTRKQELVSQMRTAMKRTDALIGSTPVQPAVTQQIQQPQIQSIYQQQPAQPVYEQPTQPVYQQPAQPAYQPQPVQLQAPGANYQPAQTYEQSAPVIPVAEPSIQQLTRDSLNQAAVQQQMQNLANNDTFSIQTIAQQANRIQQQAPQQQVPSTNNSMVVNTEAGLHAPVFTPMSTPLPHESTQNQAYQPINLSDNRPQAPSNPDLYGPPTAIFSS